MTKNSLLLEYSVPIKNSAEIDGEFMIEGIAINETTTSNGHTFIGDELRSSAKTLIGVPLLKDHINSVDKIVGRVKNANFDETMRNIPFKAMVKDMKMKQMIQEGLITDVSVGAHVLPKDIEETEDGQIIPHNIIFKELSLVGVGADPGANFTKALNNAWSNHKSQSTNVEQTIERGNNTMSEETKSEIVESVEVTEAKVDETEKVNFKEFEDRFNAIEERIKKLEEADVDEVKEETETEEPKEETKEESEEESIEESEEEESEDEIEENYKIVEGHKSFSLERLKYN